MLLKSISLPVSQPSLWQRTKKALIRALATLILPATTAGVTLINSTGIGVAGSLAAYPLFKTFEYLITQVLYKNEDIDKLLNIPVCKTDDQSITESDAGIRGFFKNPDRYNWDYSAQNDIYVYSGMPENYYTCDCSDCLNGEYNNSIYYSDKQYNHSSYDAYRHVRPNNWINIPAQTGKLTNLFSRGGSFYAHTTDAIWNLRYGRSAVASDIGAIILGTGDLLQDPDSISQGIVEGFAGLQYHNSAINTQFGYFFVDADADKIYRFDQSLEEISAEGMFNFFKERLHFCECTDCVDQKVDGTSFYSLGIDPRYNRLLVTKNEPDAKKSFTISYDLERKAWLSFHSYIPRAYMWSRRKMYTIANGSVWEHNQDCDFQTFYGTYYPHIIEFTAVPKSGGVQLKSFSYQSSTLRTESESCYNENCSYIRDLDHTFNKVAVFNTTQSTGTIELIPFGDDYGSGEDRHALIEENSKQIKIQKNHREWDFNDIHDYRDQDCRDVPMLICGPCEPMNEVNEFGCSPENVQLYRGKVMEDDHITYRFTLDDGDSSKRLKTIYLETYTKEDVSQLNP